jgi:hypothetical protein
MVKRFTGRTLLCRNCGEESRMPVCDNCKKRKRAREKERGRLPYYLRDDHTDWGKSGSLMYSFKIAIPKRKELTCV